MDEFVRTAENVTNVVLYFDYGDPAAGFLLQDVRRLKAGNVLIQPQLPPYPLPFRSSISNLVTEKEGM